MITPQDVAVELGRPDPDGTESIQWQGWINEAQMLIRIRLGVLAALDQEVLDYVVLKAVADHIRRPDSATQVEVAVDDARTVRRYQSGKGRVTILDEWWALLSPGSTSGAFSVRPGYEPDCVTR